nr:NADH dehydrogenase subunit 6 [Hemigyrus spinosus spinosus]
MMMILIPNILITLLFNFLKHPLAMTIIMIFQTLFLSMFMSLTTKTFWLSYILLLVFLGGMLILFLYITSMASNEIFSTNQLPPVTMITSMISLLMLIKYSMNDQMFWNLFTLNTDTHSIIMDNLFLPYECQYYMLLKLYNTPASILTLMLMIYLLLTLIAIVKITNLFMGPLRSNFPNPL